jgi:exodeoxyribonuclease V
MYLDRILPQLTGEQDHGLDLMAEFLESDKQVFSIGGYAGVGKSVLLATAANIMPDALCCAPTGKAACVLRSKLRRSDVDTIHATIYRLVGKSVDPKTMKRLLHFNRLHFPGALRDETLMIDEASMIDQRMARDLIATGAKIALFGDVGQLPPVNGKQYLVRPDYTLQTIHRQALGSAIIRQAHNVRRTGRYEPDGPDFQVRCATDDDYLVSSIIITFFRKTRWQVNNRMRQLLGFTRVGYPQAGEQILCLMNAPLYGVYNGGVYTTVAPYSEGTKTMVVDVDGHAVEIPFCGFTTGDDLIDDEGLTTTFSFGYAVTGHKSQGSEWENVLVVDECPRWVDRRRWRYTAFTRATSCVLVARAP